MKLSPLENLSGRKLTWCGLTACHIPETSAPWVLGQTSFPFFEVESTPVRTLGRGEGLALDCVVGFLGESYHVAVIRNHIASVQKNGLTL